MKRNMQWLRTRSVRELEELGRAVQEVICQKREVPDDHDIAIEYAGDPHLVADVLETRKRGAGCLRVLQRIYCLPQRCDRCPHGPYWFDIRQNKRVGTRVARFVGEPVFSQELTERIRTHAKPPIAVVEIFSLSNSRGGKLSHHTKE